MPWVPWFDAWKRAVLYENQNGDEGLEKSHLNCTRCYGRGLLLQNTEWSLRVFKHLLNIFCVFFMNSTSFSEPNVPLVLPFRMLPVVKSTIDRRSSCDIWLTRSVASLRASDLTVSWPPHRPPAVINACEEAYLLTHLISLAEVAAVEDTITQMGANRSLKPLALK